MVNPKRSGPVFRRFALLRFCMSTLHVGNARFSFDYREWHGTDVTAQVTPFADASFQDTFDSTREADRCFSLVVTDHARAVHAHFSGVFQSIAGTLGGVLAHVVEETRRLWLAVGNEIRVYDLGAFKQIGRESTIVPYEWLRTEQTVVLVAETDLFGWDLRGNIRWTTFIDPPHVVTLRQGVVTVESTQLGEDKRPGIWRFCPDVSPLTPERIRSA